MLTTEKLTSYALPNIETNIINLEKNFIKINEYNEILLNKDLNNNNKLISNNNNYKKKI